MLVDFFVILSLIAAVLPVGVLLKNLGTELVIVVPRVIDIDLVIDALELLVVDQGLLGYAV